MALCIFEVERIPPWLREPTQLWRRRRCLSKSKKKKSQKRAFPETSRNEAVHPTSFQMKAFNVKMPRQMEQPQSVLPVLYGARVTWATSLLQL